MSRRPRPGVSRDERLSDEGLRRLQRQLQSTMGLRDPILLQWVRRYGQAAIRLIEENGRMTDELRSAIEALQEEGSLP